MSGWSCQYEVNGICLKVDGALCRPGMKGCILQGKVTFHDGQIPTPEWPAGHPRHNPFTAGKGNSAQPPTIFLRD